MNLNIQPYVGVGPLRFGMSVHQVRETLNLKPKPFLKSSDSLMSSDSFDEIGLQVHYKMPGICDAVEMGLAADPIFRGRRFIERPFSQILSWFRTIDPLIEVDDLGLTSFEFGIGLYVPKIGEAPDAPIEGVIVFEKGYYNLSEP